MNLLYFTRESHPTFRADIRVLFGRYLPRFGVQTDLVALEAPSSSNDAEWPGGKLHLCPRKRSKLVNLLAPVVHTVTTLRKVRGEAHAAYQVRDNPLQAVIVMMAARMRRIPFFYWMSYPVPESSLELAKDGPGKLGWARYVFAKLKGHLGILLLHRIVLPRAQHVFVQSARMLEEIASLGIERNKLTAVPMGVDLEAALPEMVEPATDSRLAGKRVVVYLGAMERERRIDLLFETLAAVRSSIPNILLVLAGDSQDAVHRARLRARMVEVQVDDLVLWTGWLPTQEAWRYVRAAEVGISPYPRGRLLDSASPTKAIEYMALGVPVLANDQPDQAQVLAESGAGLCTPLDPTTLAGALNDMLSSPAKLAEWSARGRPYVAQHRSYGVIGEKLAAVYHRLEADRRDRN